MLEAGITKFKCATIAEAEMLGITGAPDVLLAYQLSGPKAERFVTLIKQYPSTHYSCLVDNIAIAKSLTELAGKNKLRISVFIDLNVGMNRTGMTPDESAVSLFEQVANMNGLVPVGLHVYDGHISDADLERRTQRSNESFKQAMEVKDRLHEKGYGQIIVVAGGSPTFPIHASRPDVECSPGTFVYWDAGYAQTLSEQPFVPAALLITRIVSSPGQGLVCTDLGHKSVAAENPLERRVQFLNAPDVAFVSQSEEHLVLKMHNDHSLSVGDVLYGMPVHICPTCALYERAVVIERW